MSLTQEKIIYDMYDFSKLVYIFSHMKTNLVDSSVQKTEIAAIIFIFFISGIIFFFVLIKTLIILGYFLCMQATTAFVRFIEMLFKTKFNINCKSSCKNTMLFFWRICKKIYTFNFYIFYSRYISGFMIISFWVCLLSNFLFNYYNLKFINIFEKKDIFFYFFFLSFEFNLLIELICSTFYSERNMITSSLLSFGYYAVINIILFIAFFYTRRMEYLYGAYLLEEPQRTINILIFFILLILKINCLIKIIKFNKKNNYNNIIILFFI